MLGKFIVFEGTDGAGKSAMIDAVKVHLDNNDIDALFVQDPGGTELGQGIRELLLNPKYDKMTATTELLLYSASRSQLVFELILPALESGRTVISDRFIYSTLAYQGGTTLIDDITLESIVSAGAGKLIPDHVIHLDLAAEVGLKRISGSKDRVELKGIQYMEDVRNRYKKELAKLDQSTVTIIDAAQSIEQVKGAVLELIDGLV